MGKRYMVIALAVVIGSSGMMVIAFRDWTGRKDCGFNRNSSEATFSVLYSIPDSGSIAIQIRPPVTDAEDYRKAFNDAFDYAVKKWELGRVRGTSPFTILISAKPKLNPDPDPP